MPNKITLLMASTRQITIVTQDGKSIVIDLSCYTHTMFEAAHSFKHSQEKEVEIKVDYPLEVMEVVLSVIEGSTKLYRYDADDKDYIDIVREFYPEYEPSDDYEFSDSEDEYDDYDPYEIPKKKGPNAQPERRDEDEENEAFEKFYDAMERAERGEDYFCDI